MPLPSFIETVAIFTLASKPTGCVLNKAPVINIKPTTHAIKYDFSKTSAELTAMGSDTINPYGSHAHVTANGLHVDRPEVTTRIKYGHKVIPEYQSFCMWYQQVDININLAPEIYIAKDYNKGKCGKAILNHERKHVAVAREVTNKYSQKIGEAVQAAVNSAGVQGPYSMDNIQNVQAQMQGHIDSALNSVKLLMQNEMNKRQQAVDSKEEYDRNSKLCADVQAEISQQHSHTHSAR